MKDKKSIIIISINAIVLVLALFLNPRFQTNDDIGMIYAYSGTGIFETPTPVTAFATKIFGLMMVFLYNLVPVNIEVYTIVIYIFLFVSNLIIHKKIFQNYNYKDIYFWILILSISSFITLYFYIELQFTMVAGWLCFAGVLAIINKSNKRELLLGYILVFFSILIRPSIFPIIFGFFLLLTLISAIISQSKFNELIPYLKKVFILACLFCLVFFIDIKIHTKEEKHFLEFNTFRAGIVDFNINETKSNSNPLNWEKEELNLFKNWFYNDTLLFSNSIDYKSANKYQQYQFLEKIDLKNLKITKLIDQSKGPIYRCILILTLIPVLLFNRKGHNFIALISISISFILYYSILSILFKEPPFRVSYLLFSIAILFYFLKTSLNIDTSRFSFLRMKSILCILSLMYAFWITNITMILRKKEFAQNYCKEIYSTNIMYIRWKDFPYDYDSPFDISSNISNIKLVSIGAFSIHPSVKNNFGKFSYTNLTNDIIGKDSIVSFLLPKDKRIWKDLESAYVKFIQKYYNKNIYFQEKIEGMHCYGYTEYKLKLKNNETKVD